MEQDEGAVGGAGPGGLAPALLLARHGVDVVLVDEQARPGGQIYRQPPRTFAGAGLPPGRAYASGHALLEAVEASAVRRRLRTLVWGLFEPDESETAQVNGSTPRPAWVLALADRGGLPPPPAPPRLLAP